MADDSDFAFNLQVEEALTASLLDGAALSPNADAVPYDTVFGPALSNALQSDDLYKYERELLDQYATQAAAKRLRLDLSRQAHDRAFACEISKIPEEEWRKVGDDIQRPYGEGSSSSSGRQGSEFRVYVKGLVEGVVGGVAVAIRDDNDGLVFELSKGLSGNDQNVNEDSIELKALIEGLDAAVMLELKRVVIVTDNRLLYQHIIGNTPHMKENFPGLSNQISLLLRKFSTSSYASFVTRGEIEFVVELARKAIALEVNRTSESRGTKNLASTCTICLEDADVDRMLVIPGCLHSYCLSCMSKHVQFKLLHGILPKCPNENCKSMLELDNCKKYLSPELFDIMCQRVKEASIPPGEKIYCPYSRCSTLLSKIELQRSKDEADAIGVLGGRKCPSCGGLFCINCKVPWHSNMSCSDFKIQNTNSFKDEKKLKSLATENLWRHCPKCNHMVSLAAGCYHISCRCGHEFCYTCGAEWKNKKATCSCPIWDERNIEY